jgi:hypothetical protein
VEHKCLSEAGWLRWLRQSVFRLTVLLLTLPLGFAISDMRFDLFDVEFFITYITDEHLQTACHASLLKLLVQLDA